MQYANRKDAALKLLPYLEKYKDEEVVLLAIPRGGVPLGYYLFKHFNFPLDLLMTKKIGHPNDPEYAIGAVNMEDHIVDERLGIPSSFVDMEVKRIRNNLQKRYLKFMGNKMSIKLENKVIVIVDDGMATGNTILAAIPMLRKRKPKKIIVAVPVAPMESAQKISEVVDEFICPYLPEDFSGVGKHYQDFSEVTDEDVIRLLNDANSSS